MLNVALIAASARPQNQSAKVTGYLAGRLAARGVQCSSIDLGSTPLPLWPTAEAEHWPAIQAQLQAADALVLAVPEWHGMACPAAKNFFLYASKAELAHKPALLVGVSSGQGGAYVISEMRSSSYKNSRLCYLPEHLLVRQVTEVLNEAQAVDEADQRIRSRADYALDVLLSYAEALKPVRAAIDMSQSAFANGM